MQEETKLSRIAEAAIKRGVKPCQAFFAVFLAGLAEARVLNQAVVNLLAKSAAPKFYEYLRALGHLPEPSGDQVKDLVELSRRVYDVLEIGGGFEYHVSSDGRIVDIGFGGDGCRYCPKGVGLAEIPWTACPFPRFYETLVNMHGIKARLVYQTAEDGSKRIVVKRSGKCWFRFEIER